MPSALYKKEKPVIAVIFVLVLPQKSFFFLVLERKFELIVSAFFDQINCSVA